MSRTSAGDFLYHFTAPFHLRTILESGALKLTRSQLQPLLNPRNEEIRPGVLALVCDNDDYKPVVWLTRNPNADAYQTGLVSPEKTNRGSIGDKMTIRITVEKRPEYSSWSLFANINRADKKTRKALEAGRNPAEWYVSEHPIPISDFIEIKNMATGEVIYRADEAAEEWPEAQSEE